MQKTDASALEAKTEATRETMMIARTWHATATVENADRLLSSLRSGSCPRLKAIAGHGSFAAEARAASVEFVAMTLWDSIDTVKQFRGPNPRSRSSSGRPGPS